MNINNLICVDKFISTASLPNAATTIPYNQKLTQTGLIGLRWFISDGNLPVGFSLGFNTGIISGVSTVEGTSNFTVEVYGGVCFATRAYSITVQNPVTSIDNSLSNLVKVYPNPSKGDFNVDFGSLNLGKSVVRVYDAQGKMVFSTDTEINNNTMKITLANLANGLYLLEINSTKGNVQKRIIKAD